MKHKFLESVKSNGNVIITNELLWVGPPGMDLLKILFHHIPGQGDMLLDVKFMVDRDRNILVEEYPLLKCSVITTPLILKGV